MKFRHIGATILLALSGLPVAGCSLGSPLPSDVTLGEMGPATRPDSDIKLARPEYFLSQPPVASVVYGNYDALWNTAGAVAEDDLFTLDDQDYREGILTTAPMVSQQFFEPWRHDTGNFDEMLVSSLQLVRRTIRFRFVRAGEDWRCTPRVLVERFSQPGRRLTSPDEYRSAFDYQVQSSGEKEAGLKVATTYWYAIGRDTDMEKELAAAIRSRLHL